MDAYLQPGFFLFLYDNHNDCCIYLLLYYINSIKDIEHSPNYTAFGLLQTHQVR